MRDVALPGTAVSVSRLSFGTASLHHLRSSRSRQELLAVAFDNGFTHFDTAPLYGYGIAENELGTFLKTRRDKVTVATKIGLYPPSGSAPSTSSVWGRKVAGRLFPPWSAPVVDWSLQAAELSLQTSLKRLQTDRIDLLLLHEPTPGAFDPDSCLHWLERQSRSGRIRAWGFAGSSERMGAMLSNTALAAVLQVRDSLERHEADLLITHGRKLQLTYGYLSSSRVTLTGDDVRFALTAALRRNATGSILVSTRRAERVQHLAAVARAEQDNCAPSPECKCSA